MQSGPPSGASGATDRAVRASAAADGMREIMREISVASSEAFASVVTEQTTGGKVWDAAVHLLGYLEAHPHYLIGRPSLLECGAGTGWLGMSLAARHDLSEVVLTEMVQGGALRWLDYNVQRNRDAGVPLTTVRTAALDWAWMDQGANACPAACVELLSTRWDLVLGSDLVYNEAGVSMLPCVLAALAQPRTRILYAHTFNRFEFLDCDFLKALRAQGLRYREVWPISDEGTEPAHGTLAAPRGDAEANADGSECSFTGELFPELRLAVLLITRESRDADGDHRGEELS